MTSQQQNFFNNDIHDRVANNCSANKMVTATEQETAEIKDTEISARDLKHGLREPLPELPDGI